MILKLAKGAISDRELLLGTMYGSLGTTQTLFATKVLGGYENVLHTLALVIAVAIVDRKVVMAAVI